MDCLNCAYHVEPVFARIECRIYRIRGQSRVLALLGVSRRQYCTINLRQRMENGQLFSFEIKKPIFPQVNKDSVKSTDTCTY